MKGLVMEISIQYKPTIEYLTKIGDSIAVHSRFNKSHIKHCTPCHEDHIDFIEQCAIDEREFEEEL